MRKLLQWKPDWWQLTVMSKAWVPMTRKVGAQIDWRPLLPRITIPCLNMRGLKNGVFPPEGTAVVTKLVRQCEQVGLS